MRLTIVGCSGSYPGPDSPASCYLIEADHQGRPWRLLLDLGNGALGALQRYADPRSIDAVVLSHLHADHCLDLCAYYVLRKYHPDGPQPRIQVWGPEGTADRMARAYDLPPGQGMTAEFDFRTLDKSFSVGPFEIEPTPVSHPVATFALRVTADGRTLAYSGDTGVCAGLERAAAGADLFLVEASFVEDASNPPDLHLTGREAGQIAARAGVARTVLTHIPPWHDPARALREAREVYDGALDLAVAGASYDV